MARSSPAEVRHLYYTGCSLTQVDDALTDLVLALLAEDTADNAVNPVDYTLNRVAGLVGRDHVAHRYLAQKFNTMRDQYETRR